MKKRITQATSLLLSLLMLTAVFTSLPMSAGAAGTAAAEVSAKSISACDITLAYTTYTFNNTSKKPAVTVKDGTKTLVKDTDFTVTYTNFINAGTATATVKGKGNYTGSVNKTYTINPRAMSNTTITLAHTSYTFNNTQKKPAVTVTDGTRELTQDVDYTVTYKNNINAGTATAAVKGKGNYTGTVNKSYTINKRQISAAEIALAYTTYNYNGTSKKPAVTVTNGSKTLVKDTDYTVSYKNFINAGTATATVTGAGNYGGSVNKNYTIKPRALSNTTVTLSATSFTYDGNEKKPTPTVKDGDKTLVKGTDYTVSYKNNIDPGTATATVTGKGNYSGSVNKSFTIKSSSKKSVADCAVTLAYTSYNYTGAAKKPAVTVTDGSKTLVKDTDYTVTYTNYINAGTATATVKGKGNYTGIVNKTYTIKPRAVSNCTVALAGTSYTYFGAERKPAVTVTDGEKTLTKNTDYTVAYSNNINVGTAIVTVTGIGNYTGTKKRTFNIHYESISLDQDTTVNISTANLTRYYEFTPTENMEIRFFSTGGTDTFGYLFDSNLVQLQANDDGGDDYNFMISATLTANTKYVFGACLYSDDATASFNVRLEKVTKPISNCTVTLGTSSYTYDGTEKRPSVTVTDGGTTLSAGTHYTVAYSNNILAGTATATVTGTGTYTGSVSRSFTISYPSISLDSSRTVDISFGGKVMYYTYRPTTDVKVSFYSSGEVDTYGYLMTENMGQLATDDDGGDGLNFKITYSLTANTTYVFGCKFYSVENTGSFTVRLERDAYETITVNSTKTATITTANTLKFYTFTPSSNMKIVFYSTGDSDTKGYIYDNYMNNLSNNDDGGEGSNFSITYSVTGGVTYILGCRFYSETATGSFTVKLDMYTKPIADCTVTISPTTFTYDGSAKRPSVTVKDGGTTLTLNTHYSVAYANNVNVGTGTVTVTGKGSYTGSVTRTFTITSPLGVFTWQSDNWNYDNWRRFFSTNATFTHRELINSEYADILADRLPNADYKTIFVGSNQSTAWLDRNWGGSCYGMTATQYLALHGVMDPYSYKNTATCINDLDAPVDDMEVSSLVTYYQMLQVTDAVYYNKQRIKANSHEDNIKEILELLEDNEYVMIGIQFTSDSGHEIAAYGVEYGSYTINGINYNGRFLIIDPNRCDNNYEFNADRSRSDYNVNEDTALYFNTTTYQWALPLYFDAEDSYGRSDNGVKFNHISADMDEINSCGYFRTANSKTKEAAVARLNAYNAAANSKVSKVARLDEDKSSYFNKSSGTNDIIESDLVYSMGSSSISYKGYDLLDVDSAYKVTQTSPEKLSLSPKYPNCMLSGESASGRSVIFDRLGFVEVTGENADYALSMVFNADYATDWFSIDVLGHKANTSSLTMSDDGYILTSDNLNDVKIRALNTADTAFAAFSTEYDSVLIYEIDRDTIGIKVDADGNGTYETELPVSRDSFQICAADSDSVVSNAEAPNGTAKETACITEEKRGY